MEVPNLATVFEDAGDSEKPVQVGRAIEAELDVRIAESQEMPRKESPIVPTAFGIRGRGQREADLDVPAAELLFEKCPKVILKGCELAAQVEMEIEAAMVDAA